MSEAKHTPGPWRTDTDFFHDRLDIRDESGRRIAVCIHDYPMSMARHDANARLIAAAPEMLELLEDIEKELHLAGLDQRENNAHDVSSLPAKLCIRLHAEIQKARGLQQ